MLECNYSFYYICRSDICIFMRSGCGKVPASWSDQQGESTHRPLWLEMQTNSTLLMFQCFCSMNEEVAPVHCTTGYQQPVAFTHLAHWKTDGRKHFKTALLAFGLVFGVSTTVSIQDGSINKARYFRVVLCIWIFTAEYLHCFEICFSVL